jgi:hypothetical protein
MIGMPINVIANYFAHVKTKVYLVSQTKVEWLVDMST